MTIRVPSHLVRGPAPASAQETTDEPLTPPVSTGTNLQKSSDEGPNESKERFVDVSTTFFPGMTSHPTDIILISSDNVQFHVHLNVLYDASSNGFASLLATRSTATQPDPGIPILNIPEQSDILNVVLLTIYAFNVLVAAVDELEKYGIQPNRYVKPTQPLFELIRFHMPLHPLDVYRLPSHLLSAKLDTITEEQAMRMGAVYLKRLYDLHSRRIDALKNILIRPPKPHLSIPTCSVSDQTGISRAWALSAAYLIWDARPDMSVRYIESTMGALKQHVSCEDCKESIDAQVKQCVVDWSSMKVSPLFISRNAY
ncbi:uncharacterized protein EV420DRAFT_1620711 [Desarmillaria tabescens]|uniref:BTB domain-containing protein n=1 Tax=Armillaria tabescens TaxID=1929756 RepID=A0AA39KD12_ARMTA|nr:uncharacterized protein EV420DRAFT_1620711 [Desarmillaria tabescens]KAK0458558.1 hypothetical protein EV420DRAFT_1620711 [Desarmillaria tabescens]